MTGTMSKALEAAAWRGVQAAFESKYGAGTCPDERVVDLKKANEYGAWESELVAGKAAISAYLADLAEDEELGSELVQIVADATGINRPGRMENEAVLAILEKLIARAQS